MITVAIDTLIGMMNELTQVAMSDMMPRQGAHSVTLYDMRADVPHLDPDHRRAPGRIGHVPGHPGQSLAGEEDHPGMARGADSR
jgi:hypothetical protein